MRVKRDLVRAPDAPVALTIGNFDGVHRGHQAMLARLVEAAEDLRLPPALLTFDPHPREFFSKASAPPRLSTVRSKLALFRAYGIAITYIARFDQRLASLSAADFVADVLERRLATRWLLVGEDFRFGRGRSGDLAFLRNAARTFSVEVMRTVEVDGIRASSTAVRNALADGNLDLAKALLGRNYTLSGHVAHGDKLGKRLGFPTANLTLRHWPTLSGIFAVRVYGLGDGPREGVASVGVRPTIASDGRPVAEVYLLDFDGAIYGQRISIEFLRKLRDEARFPDLAALSQQIGRDVQDARRYFAMHG
ncbi:MAG TPA: bifunctional riboflavin kinase/FAD synthetase [Casimicrobiaceae bacterium]|nr:bifunctional riboflavin kinase/FAD synthetase [Casimicrobiaceae bacterium]